MISHHHKTIFVHIPKCAGQSVERMFLEDQGLTWETREALLLRPNQKPELGPPRLAHLLARDYVPRGHISAADFQRYFKFALVRDPYDRALSLFNYLNVPRSRSPLRKIAARFGLFEPWKGEGTSDLDHFICEYLPQQFERGDCARSKFWFVRPQADFVFDNADRPLVDQIVRFEEMGACMDALRARCGVKAHLGHSNRSELKATREALQPNHLEMIEYLYTNDFEQLGYNRQSR